MARDDVQDLIQEVRAGRLSRREFMKRTAVLGLSGSALAAFLAACGASPTATALASQASGAATRVAPTVAAGATQVATNMPAGAGATVAAGATQLATAASGAATQVGPTVMAGATQVAGSATRASSPATAGSPAVSGSPAGSGATSGTLKIYSSFPRTGSDKRQTDTIVNAIKMAFEETNYKAGNFTIVYGASEDLDDGSPAKNGAWDGVVEANNAKKAVADPDAMVYIGTFNSGAAAVSIPIINEGNMGMISPSNTYVGLTKKIEGVTAAGEPDQYYKATGKRNYCRTCSTDDRQAAVGVTYAQELGVKKVYVLDDTQLYGHGIAVPFALEAKRLGIDAVGPEGIDPQATDYRSLAQKIRTSGADMMYFGGVTSQNAGKLWKDLRAVLGKDFKMMGPDGLFETAFLDAAGDAAEGSYFTFGGLPPDKLTGKGADFTKRYKEKYKTDLEAYTAYAYDAASAVVAAIARAGRKDRAAIRDALLATKDFDGVLGKWSFDQNGDNSLAAMTVNQVRSGKFEYVKTLEPKKS